ncbi:MAG: biopolymer transporter ExbD [Bacteroidales bacterium]|jgi:biopolymer transport protein ExbD|nr:biopolymer transporter ExbD [Bacteroidales bacterium]
MGKHKTPEINSGSMADIAFLLLIFFLVTTTMDTDTGIARQLPPIAENNKVKTEVEIKERNLLPIKVNQYDKLLVGGKPTLVNNLKEKAKEFIKSNPTKNELPEMEEKSIKGINSPVLVSKGIISLQNDRGTTYSRYIEIQDILVSAYNELRNEAALQYFGKTTFDELSEVQQDAIKEIYPQRISEAEPKNIGGK